MHKHSCFVHKLHQHQHHHSILHPCAGMSTLQSYITAPWSTNAENNLHAYLPMQADTATCQTLPCTCTSTIRLLLIAEQTQQGEVIGSEPTWQWHHQTYPAQNQQLTTLCNSTRTPQQLLLL
jgi:hypothetical protein